MICRIFLAALAGPLAVLALATTIGAQHRRTSLPERLDTYLMKGAKLTSAQRTQLLAGQPVTRMLDTDPYHEWRCWARSGSRRGSSATLQR